MSAKEPYTSLESDLTFTSQIERCHKGSPTPPMLVGSSCLIKSTSHLDFSHFFIKKFTVILKMTSEINYIISRNAKKMENNIKHVIKRCVIEKGNFPQFRFQF